MATIRVPMNIEISFSDNEYGMNQWVNMDLDENKTAMQAAGVESIEELFEKGGIVVIQDINTGIKHQITLESFTEGFKKWEEKHLEPLDFDQYRTIITVEIDLPDYDRIIQYAIFGEVRY